LLTVSTEGVILSCTLDVMENRDMATVDILNAFMKAKMDDLVYMVEKWWSC
jgi:hypothetical protein